MTKLFSNGCSFLVSRPKDDVHSFSSEFLAKYYNLNLFNIAMGGRGNDRISFTTKLWFYQNGFKDTFAVIGWTSSYRMDYVTNDEWKKGRIPNMDLTWRTWKISENLKFIKSCPGWYIEQTACMKLLNHVLDLQNFFVLNKIPYVMFNSLPAIWNKKISDFQTTYEQIDKKRYFKPQSSQLDFIQENNLIVSKHDPHPSLDGHKKWANQLKEFIDVNNLRTI